MIVSRWAAVAALSIVAAGASLVSVPSVSHAQKAAPKKTAAKPAVKAVGKTAAQILDGYVAATGGKAAYAKVTSIESTGTLELPAQGIKGTTITFATSSNKFYSEQNITGIGKSVTIYDGTTAWSKDPLNGVRTLSGIELAAIKREAAFNSAVEWRTQYPKVEMLGLKKVNGKDAYAIRLTPKEGAPLVQYHDVQSLLIVRADGVQESAQGKQPFEAYPSDYRAVGGIKMPYSARLLLGTIEITTMTTDVKINGPVDDSKFTKPTE